MAVHVIDRRDALRTAAAMFGAGLCAPLAAAIQACQNPGAGATNAPLTARQRALVAALAERIIPTTETPGAIAAGVPGYIEMMLGDFYPEAHRAAFLDGLEALDAHARTIAQQGFAALGEDEQDAILRDAEAGKVAVLQAFFQEAKQLTVTGYYSSEVGMTQERVYLPVPGRYDGDYPYAEVNTLFSG